MLQHRPIDKMVWSAYEYDNQRANEEYERVRELADRPVLCGSKLHEMAPPNIRIDRQGKRHCRSCEVKSSQRRNRARRANRRNRVA